MTNKPVPRTRTEAGLLTVVKNNGQSQAGSWTATWNSLGQQDSLVWDLKGEKTTFQVTGSNTLVGQNSSGGTVTATFNNPSSGTWVLSDGSTGTFTAIR